MLFVFFFPPDYKKLLLQEQRVNKTFSSNNCLEGGQNLKHYKDLNYSCLLQLLLNWAWLEGQPCEKDIMVKQFVTGLGINIPGTTLEHSGRCAGHSCSHINTEQIPAFPLSPPSPSHHSQPHMGGSLG